MTYSLGLAKSASRGAEFDGFCFSTSFTWEDCMKISMVHLMPYRDLPDDFEQRYHSVWVDPPWNELGDAEKVGQYYNWTFDELIYAAKSTTKTPTASCRTRTSWGLSSRVLPMAQTSPSSKWALLSQRRTLPHVS